MLKISSNLINAKNLLVDTGAWLILIELRNKNDEPLADQIRICSNTEDVEWPTGSGNIWTPYPFELGSFEDNSKNETGTTTLNICNIDGILNSYIEENRAFIGCIVTVRIIHTRNLNAALVPTYKFKIKSSSINSMWISFTIGSDSLFSKPDPMFKMNRTFCRYKRRLDDPLCGFTKENPGHSATCDGTLARCRELGRQLKFGGFPGLNPTDIYYG